MRRTTDQRKIHRKLEEGQGTSTTEKLMKRKLNLRGDLRSVLQQIISHSTALQKLKCMIILSDAEKIGKIVLITLLLKEQSAEALQSNLPFSSKPQNSHMNHAIQSVDI